jgi:hypothetical protein
MSSALTNFWRRDRRRATIDMGHGRTLSVEDVLDGHFRRMTRDAMTRTVDARTVEIQVDDQLRAAITVLAPDLSPTQSMTCARSRVSVPTCTGPWNRPIANTRRSARWARARRSRPRRRRGPGGAVGWWRCC